MSNLGERLGTEHRIVARAREAGYDKEATLRMSIVDREGIRHDEQIYAVVRLPESF